MLSELISLAVFTLGIGSLLQITLGIRSVCGQLIFYAKRKVSNRGRRVKERLGGELRNTTIEKHVTRA